MSWFTDRHFFLLAVACYGLSMIYSFFLWRRGFREDNRLNYLILLTGFGLNALAMFKRGFTLERCPVNNLYEALTFVTWAIVSAYLVLGLLPRLRFLGAFSSPVLFGTGVLALMPALDVRSPHPEFSNGLISLHAALILLAYGGFGLSSIAGTMYLTQEKNLKQHKLSAIYSLFPPIERLEKVMSRLLLAGFVLLTFGLALTPFIPVAPGSPSLLHDPKVIWALLVWAVYLALVIAHEFFDQTGRRFAFGIIGTFAFVLLTFWGFNLLSPTHHP